MFVFPLQSTCRYIHVFLRANYVGTSKNVVSPNHLLRPFLSSEFANCTSETTEARSFLAEKIFLLNLKRPSFYSF
jgi:hypothetical protein